MTQLTHKIQHKIYTQVEDFLGQAQNWKKEEKTIVFTNGCFDILHRGHLDYLEQISKLGDRLVIGVNSDSSVKRLKGEDRPINTELDRSYVLASLAYVDAVVVFSEDTPINLINSILPDVLAKGGDYKIKDIVGAEEVTANGGKVLTTPIVYHDSTSSILEKIKRI